MPSISACVSAAGTIRPGTAPSCVVSMKITSSMPVTEMKLTRSVSVMVRRNV